MKFENDDKFNFKTIEEAKNFINSPESKNGAICIVDKNGTAKDFTIDEIVNIIGIDKTAEMLVHNGENMKSLTATEDDIKELFKRFEENPDSLTDEEIQIIEIMNKTKLNPLREKTNQVMACFLATISSVDDFISNYGLLLGTLISVCKLALVQSSNTLSKCSLPALEEMARQSKNSITLDENINKDILLLGLFNILQEKFVEPTIGYKFDIAEMATILNISKEEIDDIIELSAIKRKYTEKEQSKPNIKQASDLDIRKVLKES